MTLIFVLYFCPIRLGCLAASVALTVSIIADQPGGAIGLEDAGRCLAAGVSLQTCLSPSDIQTASWDI
jgi:hypothetical protein